MKVVENNGQRFRILLKLLKLVSCDSVLQFQRQNGLAQDGKFGLMSYKKLYSAILNVVEVPFDQYPVGETFNKNQIVIHHSAGWDNARGVFSDWQKDSRNGVCTSCAIEDGGILYRGFDEQFWGHALGIEQSVFSRMGVKNSNNLSLNREAIQIEICAFGALTNTGNGNFKNYIGGVMPSKKVDKTPFRGFPAFERYTDAEIDTLEKWIILNALRFEIPLDYKGSEFWNVSRRALSGEPGIWGHCSFRQDKTDPYPSIQLIQMLQNLKSWAL